MDNTPLESVTLTPSVHNQLQRCIRDIDARYGSLRLATRAKRNRRCVVLNISGEGARCCLNKTEPHQRAEIYFVLTPAGLQQRCHAKRHCPQYRLAHFAVSEDVVEALFESDRRRATPEDIADQLGDDSTAASSTGSTSPSASQTSRSDADGTGETSGRGMTTPGGRAATTPGGGAARGAAQRETNPKDSKVRRLRGQ